MFLIVGLGNPGRKFQKTRHNLGFRVIDQLLESKQLTVNKKQKKFKAEIFEAEINKTKIVLAKPRTFMNLSGGAVKKLFTVYCSLFSDLWIVHDDIDLPLGKIRISKGRGSAGHKGVQSIINELGRKDFVRFRIGIKPKQNYITLYSSIEKFVLGKFNKKEEKILKKVIKNVCQALKVAIKEGVEKAMQEFNK